MGVLEKFVEKLLLYRWDWIAILISIIAVVIAFFTLKSQLQTQKNTTPIVSKTVQFSLLSVLIDQIVKTLAINNALRSLCKQNSGNIAPEEYVLHWLCLDQSFVHEELFYSESRKFESAHILRQRIADYNYYVDTIIRHRDADGMDEKCCGKVDELIREVATELNRASKILTIGEKHMDRDAIIELAKDRVEERFRLWNAYVEKHGEIKKGECARFSSFVFPLNGMYSRDSMKAVFESMTSGTMYYYNKLELQKGIEIDDNVRR